MSLRAKLTIVVLGVLTLLTAFDYFVQRAVVFPQFVALERSKAEDDLRRCREAIDREIEHLSIYCNDWSAWDDTYKFIQDGNEEYKVANLTPQSMISGKRNLDLFLDTNRKVVWRRGFDLENEQEIEFEEFSDAALPALTSLCSHKDTSDVVAGIMPTRQGPMLVASRPIVTSQATGPIRGTLVFGRLLTAAMIDHLAKQTRVPFRAIPDDQVARQAGHEERRLFQAISDDDAAAISDRASDNLLVAGRMAGIDGRPALWLSAAVSRGISERGATTLQYSVLSHAVTGTVIVGLLILGLHMVVVAPLQKLTRHAIDVGKRGDWVGAIQLQRSDEIGMLAGAFNDMVLRLGEYRQKIADSSRKAGMSDVATGVLHNLGNVLNSVNVATDLLTENVRKSRVDGVRKAVSLLQENREHLSEFLERDPRGQRLPTYLEQLATFLAQEQAATLDDLAKLRTSLDHMNQIVQSQHAFAKPVAHVEPVSVAEVVETVFSMLGAGLTRHGIVIDSQVAEMPLALLDRQKLLQILANLVTNAKEAMGGAPMDARKLSVRATREDGNIRIVVADSGMGIPADTLRRIFSNGFTTKAGGLGYGLHYCAITAQEMGGQLHAGSDGAGQGATFCLEIPFKSAAEAKAA